MFRGGSGSSIPNALVDVCLQQPCKNSRHGAGQKKTHTIVLFLASRIGTLMVLCPVPIQDP